MCQHEITAIGARESSGAEADWGALPVAVVDVGVVPSHAGTIERLAEPAALGDLRDFAAEAIERSGCANSGNDSKEKRQMFFCQVSDGRSFWAVLARHPPASTG
jgi:hypothetical protein